MLLVLFTNNIRKRRGIFLTRYFASAQYITSRTADEPGFKSRLFYFGMPCGTSRRALGGWWQNTNLRGENEPLPALPWWVFRHPPHLLFPVFAKYLATPLNISHHEEPLGGW